MNAIPAKNHYKVQEVCQYTDTQPYVLRFWESEFPQLSPEKRGGQSLYSRQDIDLILRIKTLLYEQEYTIKGARKALDEPDTSHPTSSSTAEATEEASEAMEAFESASDIDESSATILAHPGGAQVVSRERYNDAVEEVAELRLRVQELETLLRKSEKRVDELASAERSDHEDGEIRRQAADRLRKLIAQLKASAS